MSQCARCRKYVHSGCDPEADRALVQRKKEMNPEYDYQCPPCKINPVPLALPPSEALELGGDSSSGAGQESLQQVPSSSMISSETESCVSMDLNSDSGPVPVMSLGIAGHLSLSEELAKAGAVPVVAGSLARVGQKVVTSVQSAGKIARKRISGPASAGGNAPRKAPAGKNAFATSAPSGSAGSFNRKANKVADFNRKRTPKPKMRGVFGAPGVGLQRLGANSSSADGSGGTGQASSSQAKDGTNEGEPCLENRLVLCSATDSFVVDQDTCAMCGSFGLDQEGRLIACAQCGQVCWNIMSC